MTLFLCRRHSVENSCDICVTCFRRTNASRRDCTILHPGLFQSNREYGCIFQIIPKVVLLKRGSLKQLMLTIQWWCSIAKMMKQPALPQNKRPHQKVAVMQNLHDHLLGHYTIWMKPIIPPSLFNRQTHSRFLTLESWGWGFICHITHHPLLTEWWLLRQVCEQTYGSCCLWLIILIHVLQILVCALHVSMVTCFPSCWQMGVWVQPWCKKNKAPGQDTRATSLGQSYWAAMTSMLIHNTAQ